MSQARKRAKLAREAAITRAQITQLIRKSGKAREIIAREMSALVGSEITKRALDSYTADSADQNRWPAQYDIAFCIVLNDFSLLSRRVERAGFHVIGRAERQLLELGRQTLIAERAQAEIARLKSALAHAEVA